MILLAKHYKTIVIDPPWPGPGEARSMKGAGTKPTIIPYSTMTGVQCAALNLREIAADGATLWCWATSRSVGDAYLLLQLWGFRYGGLFIWQKPGPGLGAHIRHDSEFLLMGHTPGHKHTLPAPQQTHRWPKPKRHSEKPAEAYAMIREKTEGPRIDIFSRQTRPGFEAWGNQSGTLDK
jgi:N6-adenosine-specific RNA methylase IME4